jgi:hypothetical protein
MSASLRVLLVCLIAMVEGCSGDDSTGPSRASVAGSWTLSASNVSGSGVSCSLGNTPMTLTQSGDTFTGSYGPGTLTCVAGGESISGGANGTIVNGVLNGNSVQFDLNTQDLHHTGTISGNSMSGTARWTFDLGAGTGVVVLNGNWSAAKQ